MENLWLELNSNSSCFDDKLTCCGLPETRLIRHKVWRDFLEISNSLSVHNSPPRKHAYRHMHNHTTALKNPELTRKLSTISKSSRNLILWQWATLWGPCANIEPLYTSVGQGRIPGHGNRLPDGQGNSGLLSQVIHLTTLVRLWSWQDGWTLILSA